MQKLDHIRKLIWAIAIVMSISSASAQGNPGSQIYEKDRAAIVLVASVVTGTVEYPSFNWVQGPGNLVGSWSSSSEILTFTDKGYVTSEQSQASYTGYYTVSGDTITFNYISPSQFSKVYTYSISGNTLTLSNSRIFTYTREGNIDIIASLQNMMPVKESGLNAKIIPVNVEAQAFGTGFIITSDGYIITNAHVVLAGEDTSQTIFNKLAYDLKQSGYQEISQYYNIPDKDKDQVVKIITQRTLEYIANNGRLSDVNVNYYVFNGVAEPGENIKIESWPATKIIAGEETPGRDVAILKVEQNNLKTVPIGDSDNVNVGDRIYVIGYPGGPADSGFEAKSRLEPTMTSGIISARKVLTTGINTIQTDATINHGNSGGPAFNENGEVIGIATFGKPGVGNFLMPINLAKEFMRQVNVLPAPVQTTFINPFQNTPIQPVPVPVETTPQVPGFENAWLIVLIILMFRKIK